MANHLIADLKLVLKGAEQVAKAMCEHGSSELRQSWHNSSVRTVAKKVSMDVEEVVSNAVANPQKAGLEAARAVSETAQRLSMVPEGIKQFSVQAVQHMRQHDAHVAEAPQKPSWDGLEDETHLSYAPPHSAAQVSTDHAESMSAAAGKVLETPTTYSQAHVTPGPTARGVTSSTPDSPLSPPMPSATTEQKQGAQWIQQRPASFESAPSKPRFSTPRHKPMLTEHSKATKVPASRVGRLMSYGGLAAGLGLGALAEVTRRTLGMTDPKTGMGSAVLSADNPFLTQANISRIVDTLCKVRGAALKIGQILSIQDNTLVSPQIQAIFERVRHSADFMPEWQMERVMVHELGPDWESKFASFERKPFAAASIGQVHLATLHDGREVAIKIQYPGVAEGINSDINNLMAILKYWDIIPKGMYIDNVVAVARRELAWEVDYLREAECAKKFKKLVEPYPEYYVPDVIDELSAAQVYTTELISGTPVDKLVDASQELRNRVSYSLLKLCLLELYDFNFMQTDPNWSNFFYNGDTDQLMLLDFGACREYDKSFVDKYMRVIKAAADRDESKVLEYSMELGFLTGYEAKVMQKAHVDAVMILGEAFSKDGPFNFGMQDTTRRIQSLVPVMLQHRLTPPPEETYSLHRKLSGIFLLCAKLRANINCKDLFDETYARYRFKS
uniref:Chaperone activity of bc1 complex like mitochondrial n=1 Tax=Rhipicephalus appendiculatus TaxID=34631 RepID=A0A131YDK4_RHIAP